MSSFETASIMGGLDLLSGTARNAYLNAGGNSDGVVLYKAIDKGGNFYTCPDGCEQQKWEKGKSVKEPHVDFMMGNRGLYASSLHCTNYLGYYPSGSVALLYLRPEYMVKAVNEAVITSSIFEVLDLIEAQDNQTLDYRLMYHHLDSRNRNLATKAINDISTNVRDWKGVLQTIEKYLAYL